MQSSTTFVVGAAVALIAALAPCAPAAPATTGRNNLWLIVSLKCMRHLAKSEAPIPCDSIDNALGWDRGVALLKASVGKARMLAIPTHPVTGIEDPAVLAKGEPNYFAIAWSEQYAFPLRLHAQPPSRAVAVVVDSKPARDQDQLHLIVDCLDPTVVKTLEEAAPRVTEEWRPAPVAIKGRTYWARRVNARRVEDLHPFHLLADDMPGAKQDLADWSLALTKPASLKGAFLLLADKAQGAVGGRPQELLDPACAVVVK